MEIIFKVGDKVKCLKTVNFSDGTSNFKGEIVEIQEDEENYYNLFKEDYELVELG